MPMSRLDPSPDADFLTNSGSSKRFSVGVVFSPSAASTNRAGYCTYETDNSYPMLTYLVLKSGASSGNPAES